MIKIKDFAEETGFSIRMLRYLEEIELLIPTRDESNYRTYTLSQIDQAKQIKRLQSLGIQLKEIEELNSGQWDVQLRVFETALEREQEIAEIKSDTIPVLKNIVDFLKIEKSSVEKFFQNGYSVNRKLRTIGDEGKFHRTAYNIPILKVIYEDHLTLDANIDLIATDVMKFKFWDENRNYDPDIFSAFQESAFVLGKNINSGFLKEFETSWRKFLPTIGLQRLNDFVSDDISQVMGPHDIVIRSLFQYKDSGEDGEIVIPYTSVYTLAQLRNTN